MKVIWEHPEWLNALWAIPVLGFVWILHESWSARARRKLGSDELARDWIKRRSGWRIQLRNGLLLLALCCGIIALANPQKEGEEIEVEQRGLDIVLAVDMSRSMMAEDVAPSRLEQAKQFARRIIDETGSDRIGVIAFSDRAYPQLPITPDHASARMIINNLSPRNVPSSGSDVASALKLASDIFDKSTLQDKALIILSDGEDHPALWEDEVQNAVDSGLTIFTVGIGTSSGGPIPVQNSDRFHKDAQGEVVITRRQEASLKEIADRGNGIYFNGNITDEASELIAEIRKLQLAEFGMTSFEDLEDQFQFPLGLGLLLLTFRSLLSERSSEWFKRWMA